MPGIAAGVATACEGGEGGEGKEQEEKEREEREREEKEIKEQREKEEKEKKEKKGGFIGFAFSPGELKWKSKETGAKKIEIKVIPGSDGIKLLKQKTNDETDFETKDPNGCMGKTVLSPCTIEVRRKTTTKTSLKWYQFEFEDENIHHNFTEWTAVDLEGQ